MDMAKSYNDKQYLKSVNFIWIANLKSIRFPQLKSPVHFITQGPESL